MDGFLHMTCALIAKNLYQCMIVVFASMFSVPILAQTACPSPGICFETQQAKDIWAAKNNCVFGTNPPPTSRDCSEKWRADSAFLALQEGELVPDGYVPKYKKDIKDKKGNVIHKKNDVIGFSGVTISTGVDLGQQSYVGTEKIIEIYIKNFGNADNVDVTSLLKKLNPYFGKKRENAVAALHEKDLHVAPEENKLLAKSFGFNTQELAEKQFNRKNTLGMKFKQLPKEIQTVMVDFSYQYYIDDTKDSLKKKFWEYTYNGQWKELSEWLKSQPDQFKDRRKSEGQLLQDAIDSGVLPSSGNPCAS